MLDTLVGNALLGFVLVLLILNLTMNRRLAFWVAVGIPTSFLGALLLMPGFDVSINMISLFAFIITLGIVVDDAIVVGENIYEKIQSGMPKAQAAILGAQEMVTPVTFSVLTTMVAFSPLFLVPGVTGKIFRILPIVVIAVLGFSVIESFFVLPAHLAHVHTGKEHGFLGVVDIPRRYASDALRWFIDKVYAPVLDVAIAFRYAAFAAATGLLIISVGICASGALPFSFFPVLEGDTITASARLPYGTPVERTQAVQQAMEAAAYATVADLDPNAFKGMYSTLGTGPARGGPGGGVGEVGSHLITVQVELVPGSDRDFSAEAFSFAWEAATPPQSGLEALVFNANVGPSGGAAVDVQLRHSDVEVLAQASQELTETLRTLGDLTSVQNAYSSGKEQLDLHMLPSANSMGLTGLDAGSQVRHAFYGSEAIREQRGRSEIKVMVRLPEHQRASEYDLDTFLVRNPAGDRVPLMSVAQVERNRAPTVIRREDGQRVVNVTANKAAGVESPRDVLETIQQTVLPALVEKFPGLKGDFVGEQRDQAESLNSLGMNYLIALVGIYALLAVPFKSYTQPLIVMTAIPFSFTGVVAGHMLLGYGLSVISMMGIVALSGVVVNDSLVLIDAANSARREGKTPRQAIIAAGTRRFRPILLTSLTTFFGLAPMIIETEVQARFLIPMAISLGFGVMYATFIVLLVVPGTYLIVEDGLGVFKRIGGFFAVDDDEMDAPPAPNSEGV
jgi:multidrug efflux pump subunit AcrB